MIWLPLNVLLFLVLHLYLIVLITVVLTYVYNNEVQTILVNLPFKKRFLAIFTWPISPDDYGIILSNFYSPNKTNKTVFEILIGIILNLQTKMERTDIFTLLRLSIQEHSFYFILFISFLCFSVSITLKVLQYFAYEFTIIYMTLPLLLNQFPSLSRLNDVTGSISMLCSLTMFCQFPQNTFPTDQRIQAF